MTIVDMRNSTFSYWDKQKNNRQKNSVSMKLKSNSPSPIPLSMLEPTANPSFPENFPKIHVPLSIINIKPIWKPSWFSWKSPTTLKSHKKITTTNTTKPSLSKLTSLEALKILWVKWKTPLKTTKSSISKTGLCSIQSIAQKVLSLRLFFQPTLQPIKLTKKLKSMTIIGLKNPNNSGNSISAK